MSKTTPVRWWRDDDQRYALGRPPASPWGESALEYLRRERFEILEDPTRDIEWEQLAPLPPLPPPPFVALDDQDPGDEHRPTPWAMYWMSNMRCAGVVCYYPGRPLYAPPMPDHDPGDEQPVVVAIEPIWSYADGI